MYGYDVLTKKKTECGDCVRVDIGKGIFLEVKEIDGGLEIRSSGMQHHRLLVAPTVSNVIIVTTTRVVGKVKNLM